MTWELFGRHKNSKGDAYQDLSKSSIIFHPPINLVINKFVVAVGLFWQPLRNDLSLIQQAKLASGNRHNLDLFQLASNGRQVGFASSKEGYTAKMLAGANLFDQQIPEENWLAVFKLVEDSDYWWIVAKRYGAIYQDKIFYSKKTALEEYSSLIKAPDWERVIAPQDWNIKDAEEMFFGDSLTLNPNRSLKPIRQNRRWLIFIPLILVIAGLTVVTGNRAVMMLVNRGVPTDKFETVSQPTEITKPWLGKSRIVEFTSTCVDLMEEMFFISPGWEIISLVCRQDRAKYSVSARVNRDVTGSLGFLRQSAFDQTGVVVIAGCNGDCAHAQLEKIIGKAPYRPNEHLWKSQKVEQILRERFQTLHTQLNLNHRGPRKLNNNPNSPNATNSRHDISIKTGVSIGEYADVLKDIPGMVPETLVYTPANNTWLLTAKIFHHIEISENPDKIQL